MDQDNPTSPYTTVEQRRIMHDLQASYHLAVEQQDEARTFYTGQLINHDEDYD